jgi:predicted nucleotidyltransferase
MDRQNRRTLNRRDPLSDRLVIRFAKLMRDRYGADLYLFGSRARRTGLHDSDYDFAAVSPAFAQQRDLYRALDRHRIWTEAGGYGIGLDLHCYTPEEFARELDSLGYLGEASQRGELIKIPTDTKDAA